MESCSARANRRTSHKGDKARKGLQRIKLPEGKFLHHCAQCTGVESGIFAGDRQMS